MQTPLTVDGVSAELGPGAAFAEATSPTEAAPGDLTIAQLLAVAVAETGDDGFDGDAQSLALDDFDSLLARIGEARGYAGRELGDIAEVLARGASQCPASVGDNNPLAGWLNALVAGYARGQQHRLYLAEARLQQVRRTAVRAVETERARLAREIHDEAGQLLSATIFQVDRALSRRDQPAGRATELKEIRGLLIECSRSLHALSVDLRPPILADLGLVATLQWFARQSAERYPFALDLELGDLPTEIDDEVALAIFRIVQEAVANAGRHAKARRVTIAVAANGRGVDLTISDDGVGFQVETRLAAAAGNPTRPSLGITGIGERVAALGGRAEVSSQPGQGTTVAVWLPSSVRRKGI